LHISKQAIETSIFLDRILALLYAPPFHRFESSNDSEHAE